MGVRLGVGEGLGEREGEATRVGVGDGVAPPMLGVPVGVLVGVLVKVGVGVAVLNGVLVEVFVGGDVRVDVLLGILVGVAPATDGLENTGDSRIASTRIEVADGASDGVDDASDGTVGRVGTTANAASPSTKRVASAVGLSAGKSFTRVETRHGTSVLPSSNPINTARGMPSTSTNCSLSELEGRMSKSPTRRTLRPNLTCTSF